MSKIEEVVLFLGYRTNSFGKIWKTIFHIIRNCLMMNYLHH